MTCLIFQIGIIHWFRLYLLFNVLCRITLPAIARKAVIANQFVKSAKVCTESQLASEMRNLASWEDFDINAVSRLSQRQPLQAVGLACFQRYGLIEKFSIPDDVMHNFLAAVEDHYLCEFTLFHLQ